MGKGYGQGYRVYDLQPERAIEGDLWEFSNRNTEYSSKHERWIYRDVREQGHGMGGIDIDHGGTVEN